MKIENGVLTKVNRWNIRFGQFTVPKDVKEIGFEAFRNCTKLKKIKFLGDIDKIGYHAFDGCSSLSEIETPDGKLHCKVLDRYAFANCDSLKKINLSEDLLQISDMSFVHSPTDINIDTSLFSVDSEFPVYDGSDFYATIYGENVFFRVLNKYNNFDTISGCLHLDIKKRELKDRIAQCLKDNNIDDAKYFEYHEHEKFIEKTCDKFQDRFLYKYDYRDDFNNYMERYISDYKSSEEPEIITFDEGQDNSLNAKVEQTLSVNVTNNNIQNNDSPISQNVNNIKSSIVGETLKNETVRKAGNINPLENYDFNDINAYADRLGLTPWVDKLKQRISLSLLASNAPKKCFNDICITHVAFIREMLQCLSEDKTYDYKRAVDNYIKNYIETYNLQKENNDTPNNLVDEKVESIKIENLISENDMLKQKIAQLEQELSMKKNQGNNTTGVSLDKGPIIEVSNNSVRKK